VGHNYNVREIASGMGFVEGPVALPDGSLLVADLTSGWLLKIDPQTGRVDRHAYTGGGPNGLALGPDGACYVCNNGGFPFGKGEDGQNVPLGPDAKVDDPRPPCIQRVSPDGEVTILYQECDGNPFSAPNDLVFDAHGGFYFTDLGHAHGRLCDLGGLYYGKADGSSVVELIHEPVAMVPLTQPNGVGLSPAGDRVYVAETVTARVWAWAVEGPGKLAPMPQPMSGNGASLIYGYEGLTMFDSLAVDSAGYICVGTLIRGGISVLRPDGGLEDYIPLPEHDPFVTNICFGGPDMRTAYVTGAAMGKLWAMDWPREGLRLNY
jgi:gluconolactonase